MIILLLIGFVAAIFSFSVVAGFFWVTLPKWLGLESEGWFNRKGEWVEDNPNKFRNFLGWIYIIVAIPVGLVIGGSVALIVFNLITGQHFG